MRQTGEDQLPTGCFAGKPMTTAALSAHLDTRVKVEMGPSKGRVVVDFATLEDLERIYRAMTGDVRPPE